MKPLAQIGRTAVRYVRAARDIARPQPGEHRLLYIFSGKTPGWRPPGAALWRESARFRAGIEAAAPTVEAMMGFSAAGLVAGEREPASPGEAMRADIVAMLLVQLGLVDLWRDAGVVAGGALGISGGEVAAAYAVGALSRADAVRIICAIARRLEHRSVEGRLFVIEAAPDQARRLERRAPRPLQFAGEVMPGVCAMESDAADAAALRPWLAQRAAIRDERPRVHLYHVEGIGFDEAAFRADVAGIDPRPPVGALYLSACDGRLPHGMPLDAGYWHWMPTSPYRFAGAAAAAAADGFDRAAVFAAGALGDWYLQVAPRALRARLVRPMDRGADGARPWHDALEELAAIRFVPAAPAVRQAPAQVDPATLDLAAPAIAADPYPAYEALRRLGPVHYLPRHGGWLVLSHAAVRDACARPQTFSNRPYGYVDPVLIGADPPRHAAVRRLLAPFFAAEPLARAEALAAARAAALLRPRFDLVRDYAAPIARAVAADLIGLDEAGVEAILDVEEAAQAAQASFAETVSGFDPIVARARVWALIRDAGEGLIDGAEATSLVRFLWLAATTTTERAIVRAGMRLVGDAALRDRLAADPALVRPFVEEVMRLHAPEHMLPRLTTEPAELAGVAIPAGARVMLCISAANRDPQVFEAPDALRLDRGASRHLSFGSGSHVCIGAALARRVIPAAVAALVEPPARLRVLQPLATVRCLASEMTLAPVELTVAA